MRPCHWRNFADYCAVTRTMACRRWRRFSGGVRFRARYRFWSRGIALDEKMVNKRPMGYDHVFWNLSLAGSMQSVESDGCKLSNPTQDL